MTSIINWIISPIDSINKWNAGPRPNLDPKAIIADIDKDQYLSSIEFKLGQRSVHSNSLGANYEQFDSIKVIQRALIAIGLISVKRNENYWWSSSNFAWGTYGRSTISAVLTLQKEAGITGGHEGRIFGPESLDALKKALAAKAEGKDWKTAVHKPPKTAAK